MSNKISPTAEETPVRRLVGQFFVGQSSGRHAVMASSLLKKRDWLRPMSIFAGTSLLRQVPVSLFQHNRSILTLILIVGLAVSPCLLNAESPKPLTIEGLKLQPPTIPASVTGVLRSLNESLARDVDPSENAAVVLVQILGDDLFEPSLKTASLEMLGIAELSPTAARIEYADPYVKSRGATDLESVVLEKTRLEQQLVTGMERAWSAKELPLLADFLAANRDALRLVREAAAKPKYYAPMLSDDEPARLLSCSLAIERRLPFLVQLLCAQAMQRLNEGDLPAAFADLFAGQRLAVLLAAGSPFDVTYSKAQIMDAIVFQSEKTVLESGLINGPQAKAFLNELKASPAFPLSARAADRGERAILHQEIEFLKGIESSLREFFELADEEVFQNLERVRLSEIKWDEARKRGDELQDRIVRALSIADRPSRVQQLEQLDQDYQQWVETADAKTAEIGKAVDKDLTAISRWVGETMAMSLKPWYWQRSASDDRNRVRRDMIQLGLALVAYRADHNEFPAALKDLTPGYLTEIPLDAQSNTPFQYARLPEDRAQLASWGINGRDDAGQPYNDDRILDLRGTAAKAAPVKDEVK